MKNKIFMLLCMGLIPLYLLNMATISVPLSHWDGSEEFDDQEESELDNQPHALDLSHYHFDVEELTKALEQNPPSKITLEQIEQGKFPDPAHVKHLEVTRQSKEHPLRAAHLGSLIYLYPKITELTLTNLGVSEKQAHEIASHFPKLGFHGPVVKETGNALTAH